MSTVPTYFDMSFQLLLEKFLSRFEILAKRPDFDWSGKPRKPGITQKIGVFRKWGLCFLFWATGMVRGRKYTSFLGIPAEKLVLPVAQFCFPVILRFSIVFMFVIGDSLYLFIPKSGRFVKISKRERNREECEAKQTILLYLCCG